MTESCLSLLQSVGNLIIRQREPLASHCSFSIGGPASYALFPQTDAAFLDTLSVLYKEKEPFITVGNGTNLLFDDEGYDGIVLFTTALRSFVFEKNTVTCSAGVPLSSLCVAAKERGLGGLAFAYGIPGTVGGAVRMNAGAFGGEIADVFVSALVFDRQTGETKTVSKEDAAFGYRTGIFQTAPFVLLSAVFRLAEEEKEKIAEKMREVAEERRRTQPLSYPSAGSIFRRPPGHFAGKLIEEAGLLGYRIGGAEISEKHGGFIINRGGAASADVLALIAHIQKTVSEKSGVFLEPEIIRIPKN